MVQNFQDFVDIFKLIAGQTPSNNVGNYVMEVLGRNNIPFDIDRAGNIYNITNKGIPLFVAHMDTVRDRDGECPALIIKSEQHIMAVNKVLGGDDLNGVFLLINLLLERKINFLFTMDEETVKYATSKFFIMSKKNFFTMRENIPYFVVLDRKGDSDLILEGAYNRYGTEAFEKAIGEFGKLYSYKVTTGIMCDADYLQLSGVSGCNISVGYYHAHSIEEYVKWTDVLKAFNFIRGITDSFKFNEPPKELAIVSKKKLKEASKKKASESVT